MTRFTSVLFDTLLHISNQSALSYPNMPLQCPILLCQSLTKHIDHRKSGSMVKVTVIRSRALIKPLLVTGAFGLPIFVNLHSPSHVMIINKPPISLQTKFDLSFIQYLCILIFFIINTFCTVRLLSKSCPYDSQVFLSVWSTCQKYSIYSCVGVMGN